MEDSGFRAHGNGFVAWVADLPGLSEGNVQASRDTKAARATAIPCITAVYLLQNPQKKPTALKQWNNDPKTILKP